MARMNLGSYQMSKSFFGPEAGNVARKFGNVAKDFVGTTSRWAGMGLRAGARDFKALQAANQGALGGSRGALVSGAMKAQSVGSHIFAGMHNASKTAVRDLHGFFNPLDMHGNIMSTLARNRREPVIALGAAVAAKAFISGSHVIRSGRRRRRDR